MIWMSKGMGAAISGFAKRRHAGLDPAPAFSSTERQEGTPRLKAGVTIGIMRIFTIGYEGATVPEFIAALKQAGVEQVIDVRALPLSRRPGFSKTPLRNALADAGIDYVHLKALGTPAEGRAAALAHRDADLKRIYAGQLELAEAIAQSGQMLALAGERPSALLCMEREPAHCHRQLLLEAVAPGAEVVHLFA
jgi:uncharacterized protein (DUF488 family)